LQCDAVCCVKFTQAHVQDGFTRGTTTHCSTLHYTTLQHTTLHCNTLHYAATHCNTLQHTTLRCNTLQHTATHYTTLQHTALPRMTMQATLELTKKCQFFHQGQGQRWPLFGPLQVFPFFLSLALSFSLACSLSSSLSLSLRFAPISLARALSRAHEIRRLLKIIRLFCRM